jgi:hypothetical protein
MIATINYGNVANVIGVLFGNGTLEFTNSEGIGIANENSFPTKSILIKSISKDSEVGKDETSDEFKPEVVLVFQNKAAFDVFYEVVDRIHDEYLAEESEM